MINFRSTVDNSEHRVVFTPRPNMIAAKEIQRQLLYGYRCTFCRNPILFAFLTPQKVALGKYEESKVINGLQELHLIIPSAQSNHETAYESIFMRIAGKSMGVQRVRMLNHVLPTSKIGRADAAHQNGPRCCPYSAVFSERQDLLIKDSLIMGGFPERELCEYDLPNWQQFVSIIRGATDSRMFLMDGVGPLAANPLVTVRSDFIEDRKGLGIWRTFLLPFKKKKTEETTPKPAEENLALVEEETSEESTEDEESEDMDSDFDSDEEEVEV